MNCDLAALYHFGQSWQIKFSPNKSFSLIISLKCDLQLLPHPPLFLDGSVILETSIGWVLGFTFDLLLTWEPHIVNILNRGKHRAIQLYCCHSLLTSQDLSLMYKSWIHPALEYGSILYAKQLLLICNDLIVYSLALSRRAVHIFNHCFTTVMHRLLDWSVVSLLVRGKVIYRITAHYFVVLRILVTSLPVCMPENLLRICALLIQLISGSSIGFDIVGRLCRSYFGILSHRTYFWHGPPSVGMQFWSRHSTKYLDCTYYYVLSLLY